MLLNKRKIPALLCSLAFILCVALGTSLRAQDGSGGRGRGLDGGPRVPPMERAFRGMENGRWWNNPRVAEQIGLTDDQKKKMDDIFQQHRLQLIDLNAALQKQQAIMEPLIQSDQPEESKVLSQIDAIATARANLEKDRARMLFSLRQTLTADQWKKLQTLARDGRPRGDRGQGGGRRGGPDGGAPPTGQQPPPGPPTNAPGQSPGR
jgi:periplasmic protein CpxP/Spy